MVLRSPRREEPLAAELARRIAARFGFTVPVVVRSASDVAELPARNPFLLAGAPPDILHVAFLAQAPTAAAIAALDPHRSPTDRLAVSGREVFLELPNGVGRTKLSNDWLERSLGTTSTIRNWRTVSRLDAMARELST